MTESTNMFNKWGAPLMRRLKNEPAQSNPYEAEMRQQIAACDRQIALVKTHLAACEQAERITAAALNGFGVLPSDATAQAWADRAREFAVLDATLIMTRKLCTMLQGMIAQHETRRKQFEESLPRRPLPWG